MIEKILLKRIVFKIKPLSIELEKKFKIENKEFLDSLSTIKKMEEYNHDLLIIRASKIFKSKIAADREIFKWNNKKPNIKKPLKDKKEYSFEDYSKIDENGKSVKTSEEFSTFYNDIKAQYKETELLNKRMVDVLKRATYMEEKAIKSKLLPPTDVWLTADECIKLGVADKFIS